MYSAWDIECDRGSRRAMFLGPGIRAVLPVSFFFWSKLVSVITKKRTRGRKSMARTTPRLHTGSDSSGRECVLSRHMQVPVQV